MEAAAEWNEKQMEVLAAEKSAAAEEEAVSN